ncbi:MAG: hypothetical protein LWW94_04895 [Candidatus Desulfofervidaceae bacterium]|nr:hypothetical protein [Candidatus Desulfofervidaceae bacterium]
MSERDVANLLGPIVGLPGEVFYAVMKVGETLGKALNLKSSKRIERIFPYSYTYVVLFLVLFLRASQNKIVGLYDTPRGAIVEAKLPVDIFSLGGSLLFERVDEGPTRMLVIGVSQVKGQMFDWGKGKRAIKQIFDNTEQHLRRMTSCTME